MNICRDMKNVEPVLRRKVEAVLADLQGRFDNGDTVAVFETERSQARANTLAKQGRGIKKSLHIIGQDGWCHAVDVAFLKGGKPNKWFWPENGDHYWALVDSAKEAHGLLVFWDRPHLQAK